MGVVVEAGTEAGVCSVCGEEETITEEGTAIGHNYEKGVCTNCGAADPDYSAFPTTTVVIIIVVIIVVAAVVIIAVVLGGKKKKK